jgi:hypothetical protein
MDLKTSLLVYNQLPEFVREEHPLFISFLEAYYEFLENGILVDGKNNNDLSRKLKDLRYVSDVDYSLEQFEQQFFKSFAESLPKDSQVSKEFLIKNILPLYRAKGTIKSFEFLFRILFNEEISVEYPREQILRASDGKWIIENVLRTENSVYSEYISDGVRKEYLLPYEIDPSAIEITINGTLTQNYYIRKELNKIIFKVAPIVNSKIKVSYPTNFDISIFKNNLISGVTSKATSIVEKVGRRLIGGLNFIQFFIEQKNTFGQFRNGEILSIEVPFPNGTIPFFIQTLSEVESLDIKDPGSNYKNGDTLQFSGLANRQALGVVDKVSSGFLETIRLRVGNFGAGYKVGNNVFPTNISTNNFLAFIDVVDPSGSISPNTISYNTDLISNFATLNISDADYGFNETSPINKDSSISSAFNQIIVSDLGPALNVIVSFTDITPNQNPIFFANSTNITETVKVADLNSIGTIKVISGGSGYKVGDKIKFTNTFYFSGQGAEAEVSQVTFLGSIRKVKVTNGGYNYSKQFLPTLTVESANGSNANVVVEHFMGQDALFDYESGDGIPGKIQSIKILDKGSAYKSRPSIKVLSSNGSGAVITAQTTPSLMVLPGRWITSDGMLSTDEVKLQGGNYYVDFSYLISSQVEFKKYKQIVSELLNPSGAVNYSRYTFVDVVDVPLEFDVQSTLIRNLVGTVNVTSNSVDVIGTDTYFSEASNIGLIQQGSYIIVNSEIMIVNNIINNTYLTTTNTFNFTANNQLITIINDFDTILTESLVESEIEGGSNIFITTEGVEE